MAPGLAEIAIILGLVLAMGLGSLLAFGAAVAVFRYMMAPTGLAEAPVAREREPEVAEEITSPSVEVAVPERPASLIALEAHLRHRLAAPDLELDLGLGALGELDAVLAEHAVGSLAVRDAIGRLEAIERRLDAGPARIAGPTSRAAQQRGKEGPDRRGRDPRAPGRTHG